MTTHPRAWTLSIAMLVTGGAALAQSATPDPAPPPPQKQDCRPEYPEAALRAGAQGVTTLAFHVNAQGVVTQTDIVKSSGHSYEHHLLDRAAADALSRCHLDVSKIDKDDKGEPIPSIVTVHYAWKLE